MIDPTLWNNVPFKNPTALKDFGGQHALWHRAVAETSAKNGKPYRTYPLGDGVGSKAWQQAHLNEHANANAALGLQGPVGLNPDYDFHKADDFATFMLLHAQESQRLRVAAGVA